MSEEQWKKGQERIKEFGLEGQVEIELIDYRDVAASGRTFDRIVSVGMLEHVDVQTSHCIWKMHPLC